VTLARPKDTGLVARDLSLYELILEAHGGQSDWPTPRLTMLSGSCRLGEAVSGRRQAQ